MSLPSLLDSFQSSLAALQRLLDHFNNQGVIIGGIAVSLLADIESIIASYPNLDRKRVQFWVEQFAEALETPELWGDVARLLRKTK